MTYQIIGTDEKPRNKLQTTLTFAQFVNNEWALPVYGVQGVYKGELENSYRINLETNLETTQYIAKRLARVFGQESVLIIDTSNDKGYLQSAHGEPEYIGKKIMLPVGLSSDSMTLDGKHNRFTFVK